MKKTIVALISLMCLFILVSCNKENKIPKGEHTLTVEDESILYEPLKETYKSGEKIIVKTHTICDATVSVTLNGEKELKKEFCKDENNNYYYKWEFIMPDKDSILEFQYHSGMDDIYYEITLVDDEGLVINSLPSIVAGSDTLEIHTSRLDVEFATTPSIDIEEYKTIKNQKGEVLYYSWSFVMPESDLKIEAHTTMYEPTLWHFDFYNNTGVDNMFIANYEQEYCAGDIIKIEINSDALIEDHGIILKSNGILIENESYEWKIVMPDHDLRIDAYLINASFGETWKYLNVIDEENLLSKVADGYYQVGKNVVLYSDYALEISDENGNVINCLIDEGEGICEYIYTFEMIDKDLSIFINISEN